MFKKRGWCNLTSFLFPVRWTSELNERFWLRPMRNRQAFGSNKRRGAKWHGCISYPLQSNRAQAAPCRKTLAAANSILVVGTAAQLSLSLVPPFSLTSSALLLPKLQSLFSTIRKYYRSGSLYISPQLSQKLLYSKLRQNPGNITSTVLSLDLAQKHVPTICREWQLGATKRHALSALRHWRQDPQRCHCSHDRVSWIHKNVGIPHTPYLWFFGLTIL